MTTNIRSAFVFFSNTQLLSTDNAASAKHFFPTAADRRDEFAARKEKEFNKGNDKDRLEFISSNFTAGVLLAKAKDDENVQFFGLPQHNGGVFLGTTSFTYDDRPHTTQSPINGCFYHIFEDNEVIDASTFPFPVGKSFQAAEIDAAVNTSDIEAINIPGINAWRYYSIRNSTSYRIARIPIALPIPFGQKEVINIKEENPEDILNIMSTDKDKAPLVWHRAVSGFSADQHEVIADNEQTLNSFLPEGSDDFLVDKTISPYVSLEPSSSGNEENKQLLDTLKKRLTTLHAESEKYVDPRTEVDPTVNRILKILNLSVETEQYLRKHYPMEPELEEFFLHTTDELKAMTKPNGSNDHKEPLFKSSDVEEFILLCTWTENNRLDGDVEWGKFTKRSFNQFRREDPKHHLDEIFAELGIDDEVAIAILKEHVKTPDQLVRKPESLYKKELRGLTFDAIKKFKDWHSFHCIGYLPLDWVISYRAFKAIPSKEKEFRKVLTQAGLTHDVVRALKFNGIRDVPALIERTENWRTVNKGKGLGKNRRAQSQKDEWMEWEKMGLSRGEAIDIINFRHWYTFCIERKADAKGWMKQFNSANFRNFIERYGSGDNFKKPNMLSTSTVGKPKLSLEKEDFDNIIIKATEAGQVTDEQRYHLIQHIRGKEKMDLVAEIANLREEGIGGSDEQEKELLRILEEEVDKDSQLEAKLLLSNQEFCQYFFNAALVLVLLISWATTTSLLINQHVVDSRNATEDVEENDEYVTFVHNIVFGLASAVVIQELGEEKKENSLYHRFFPTYRNHKRRSKEQSFKNEYGCCGLSIEKVKSILMSVILWSTRLYIICWIILGFISLLYGAIAKLTPSNTLYTTGQTWLGIAVTIGYTYFGLGGTKKTDSEDNLVQPVSSTNEDEEKGQKPDGGGNETKTTLTPVAFTNELGEVKEIVTRHDLEGELEELAANADTNTCK